MLYIILTPDISHIGGAQLYTARRIEYLNEMGYKTVVIYTVLLKNFMLENRFKNSNLIYAPKLELPLSTISREKIFINIKNEFKNLLIYEKEITIESHTRELAFWGEFMASKLKGKHVIYFLHSFQISKALEYPGKRFFEWKLKQGSLIGLNKTILPLIMGYPIEEKLNKYVNIGFSRDEFSVKTVPSIDELIEKSVNFDFVIGTLARLDKKYIEILIEEIITMTSSEVSNKKILLIISGGSSNKEKEQLFRKKYESSTYKNLKIHFTGYVSPIGADFFNLLDVFVGEGTASINAIAFGTATLVINSFDITKTNGVLGLDTSVFGYNNSDEKFSISTKLIQLISSKEYLEEANRKGYKLFNEEYRLTICMNKMNSFINKIEEQNYYPLNFHVFHSIKDRIIYYLKKARLKIIKL